MLNRTHYQIVQNADGELVLSLIVEIDDGSLSAVMLVPEDSFGFIGELVGHIAGNLALNAHIFPGPDRSTEQSAIRAVPIGEAEEGEGVPLMHLEVVFTPVPANPPQAEPEGWQPPEGHGREVWGIHDEEFNHDSLAELIADYELEPGDKVHRGTATYPDPAEFVRRVVPLILEDMSEMAYEESGEIAENYPSVSAEARSELQALIEAWARRHCQPDFYLVLDSEVFTLDANGNPVEQAPM